MAKSVVKDRCSEIESKSQHSFVFTKWNFSVVKDRCSEIESKSQPLSLQATQLMSVVKDRCSEIESKSQHETKSLYSQFECCQRSLF